MNKAPVGYRTWVSPLLGTVILFVCCYKLCANLDVSRQLML